MFFIDSLTIGRRCLCAFFFINPNASTDSKGRSSGSEYLVILSSPHPLFRGPSSRQWHSQGRTYMIRPVNRRRLIGRTALRGAMGKAWWERLTERAKTSRISLTKWKYRLYRHARKGNGVDTTGAFGLRSPGNPQPHKFVPALR
jgi:hypothetical protein